MGDPRPWRTGYHQVQLLDHFGIYLRMQQQNVFVVEPDGPSGSTFYHGGSLRVVRGEIGCGVHFDAISKAILRFMCAIKHMYPGGTARCTSESYSDWAAEGLGRSLAVSITDPRVVVF